MVALTVTNVAWPNPRGATDPGFIGSLDVSAAHVFAVGGSYSQSTLLHSSDAGRTFTRWKTPATPGLRDALFHDDLVWVVGEQGMVATSSDAGATWKKLETSSYACLYRIELGPDGWCWITGDDGLVWRTRSGKTFEVVPTKTAGRVFQVFFDPVDNKPWLLDSTGTIQRWRRTGFRVVPQKAMRSPRPLCWLLRTRTRALVLVGDRGLILRSTNDGASWKKIPTHFRHDLEQIVETMYGLIVVGDGGTLLASCDDGRTFVEIDTAMKGHLRALAAVDGGLLVGGDDGQVYRIPNAELAKILAAAHARDPVLVDLAACVERGDVAAEMVLEDALRERELW